MIKQTRNVLVLDQSSQANGICVVKIRKGKPVWSMAEVKTFRGKVLGKRLAKFKEYIGALIEEHEIDYLVVEEVPIIKGKIKTSIALHKIHGLCQVLAHEYDIEMDTMNVNAWKKSAGITSKTRVMQKKESISLALSRFPNYKALIGLGDDLADCLNISIAWLIDMKYLKKLP